MSIRQLCVLCLAIIVNGSRHVSLDNSNDVGSMSDTLAKFEARFELKEKEDNMQHEVLRRRISTMAAHAETTTTKMLTTLNEIREEQKAQSIALNEIREEQKAQRQKIGELNNYMEQSLKIGQCDTARRMVKSAVDQVDYTEFMNCSENPYLYDFKADNEWIIFQHRHSGRVNFNRNWTDYKHGFGSSGDDFWLGLESLHRITSLGDYMLRVELIYNEKNMFADYSSFRITGEPDSYRLLIGGYSGGTVGDSLKIHNNTKFTTLDNDNDNRDWENCAQDRPSGWWFNDCHDVNLNGLWRNRSQGVGMHWKAVTGYDKFVTFSEMKIRSVRL